MLIYNRGQSIDKLKSQLVMSMGQSDKRGELIVFFQLKCIVFVV